MESRGLLTRSRVRWILGLILLAALLLRVVYVLQSRANPFFDEPAMDAAYHLEWARAFARGEEFQAGPFFRAPLYPWFLGLCLRVFGEDLLLVRLLQALIGSASCGLAYLVAARAFDRRTGLVAAALGAQYWMLVYFDAELLLPVLEVPTCLLVILAAQRWHERPGAGRALQVGLALGLAALVRPNILLFAPFLLGWMLVAAAGAPLGARARVLACAVLGLALPIAPITLHNGLAGHDWTLVSTQGGVNLWIGNNPASDGSSAIVPGTRADWWGGYQDSIQQAEAAEGRPLRPSEVSQHYVRRVRAWWAAEPRAALALMTWKLRLLLSDCELANNQDERFFALHFGPVLRGLPIGFGVLAPLGLLGLCACARSWRRHFPLAAFVPVYGASVVLFFVNARFRMPMILPMAVLAAHALVAGWDLLRARRLRPLALGLAFVAAVGVYVQRLPPGVRTDDAQGWWQLGVYAAQHGDPATALRHFDTALALDPRLARIRRDRGLALERLERAGEAEAELREARRLEPGDPANHDELFRFLVDRGRLDQAMEIALATVDLLPSYGRAHYDLGRARFGLVLARRPGKALEPGDLVLLERVRQDFATALALPATAQDRFNAAYALGETEALLGQSEAALSAWRRALESLGEPDAQGFLWRCAERWLTASTQAGGKARGRVALKWLEQRFGGRAELEQIARRLALRDD